MQQDRLYEDPDLTQFYDIENGWAEDLDYCRNLAAGRSSVLDLGCGTGLFAATLAQEDGRSVVGVDPAGPMLDIAAARPGGQRAQWVQGDARQIRLDRRFDLIVLTGHAFQVFLDQQDQAAVLRTIAVHLTHDGRFVFDSRNPAVEAWKKWTPDRSRRRIEHPTLGRALAWNDALHDPSTGVVTYGTCYKMTANDRTYSSQSRIAFPTQAQIASLLPAAGLTVQQWLGNWSGVPYGPMTPEIIPVGMLS